MQLLFTRTFILKVVDAAGFCHDPRSELRLCILIEMENLLFKHVKLSESSHSIVPCSTSIYHCRDGIYFAVEEVSLSRNDSKAQQCVSQLEQVHEIAYTFVFFYVTTHLENYEITFHTDVPFVIPYSLSSLFSLLYFLFFILCLLLLA